MENNDELKDLKYTDEELEEFAYTMQLIDYLSHEDYKNANELILDESKKTKKI